jgi:hypothetical protein
VRRGPGVTCARALPAKAETPMIAAATATPTNERDMNAYCQNRPVDA